VRLRLRSIGLLALGWTGASATGCMPEGEPPLGRQVSAGRDELPAGLIPASPDGIVRLLVLRLDRERMDSDLYLVSVDGAAPPTESLLAENLGWSNGCAVNSCFPTDRRGRVFVHHDYDPIASTHKLTRIDPVTGDRFELGSVDGGSLQFSPSGDRLAAPSSNGANLTVYESDDRATVVNGTVSAGFVGEEFYYVGVDKQLMRLPSGGGAPELVRAGVSFLGARESLAGQVLVLYALSADQTAGTITFLDPITLQETFPPIDRDVSFVLSPDGRWLFTADQQLGAHHYSIGDAMTGEQERFDGPAGAGWATVEWRPGRAELWLAFSDEALVSTLPDAWIKQPGSPPRVVPASLRPPTQPFGGPSFFTPDGSYYFSWRPSQATAWGTLQIGSADEPGGARFDVVPDGSNGGVAGQLADGRLLTAANYVSHQRNELRVIDPARGGSRTLATEVGVMAVGPRRVLATAHTVDGYGDLMVIDVDSGESTLLAAEYARMVFFDQQAPDRELLAPGSRVAFQFQGRFASPYDGIWVATVP
jgi:hypothetical protein